ncbi:nicotinamide/nicotinic acid mononucleotide adenylyltransferase 2 [Anaeramoeba ignava]|uniref:Nicotinamide/nicotinic acid mononucleotide adenylyltransferase 2 n=1 Tax=Anaeramoeba ignava TaxID=1746090 RepID=A0A9Q0L6V1_ANAIG|nr:nicotinamide/nicotinic acid mononucleotide adenylyltransferase 2 [Anaeramoeba ignava]
MNNQKEKVKEKEEEEEKDKETFPTPTKKLKEILEKKDEKNRKIVLISTGSYNPVHKMHIKTFAIAKKYLEEKHGLDVIGGYISPSHDQYTLGKLGGYNIPFKERCEMCQLAIEEEGLQDFLFLDQWEGTQSNFINFTTVTRHLRHYLKTTFASSNIDVFYLCGMDHFVKCRLYHWEKVVAMSRPGYDDSEHINENVSKDIYVSYNSEFQMDISSSEIRKRFIIGKGVEDLTYKSVIDHLKKINWLDLKKK